MDKIKVLVDGMKAVVGGRESYIMTQYSCIDTSKFQYDFVFTDKFRPFPKKYLNDVLSRGGNIFYLKNKKQWIDFLSEHKDYDYFITNSCSFFESFFFHPRLDGFSNFKKIIVHCHIGRKYPFSGFDKLFHNVEMLVGRAQFGNKDIIKWACSDIAGKWHFGDNANFEIIKNGIFIENFTYNEKWRKEIREEFNFSDSDFIIGNVGRVHMQKNQLFLIDLLAKVKEIIPTAKLMIVGPIHQKTLFMYLKHKIRKYNLETSVIFANQRNDTNKFYSAFDIFAFPSIFEGLGIVAIEAQAAGLPCLFSDAVPKAVRTREKYCQFLSNNIDSWRNAIIDIYNDKDRINLRSKSESADLVAKAGYDVKQETKRVENLLINYLDNRI